MPAFRVCPQRRRVQLQIFGKQAGMILAERAAALKSLMQQDPSEVLSLAFDANALAGLAAAFPESAANLEWTGQWKGEVESLVEDARDMKANRDIHRLS